ncbi:MAG: histidinol phosphate phosphatase domain-containing protein [Candidatus Syntrophoarchaeum sp.]|nr:histidinol phosphate phosphatase domain-containing protein [Candidatus Syntrophoarchaeum sp.]
MIDLHTHTLLSDGELVPSEHFRRALVKGYTVIGIADHVDFSNIEYVIDAGLKAKRENGWEIEVVAGVELTHIPPQKIGKIASMAKRLGAEIVVAHGETLAEPVAEGTNHASILSEDVDILAHPGLIAREDVELAKDRGILLEVSARCGHNIANGHVVRLAEEVGAELVLNTDAHAPEDMIDDLFARRILMGAGLSEERAEKVLRGDWALKEIIKDI